MQIYFSSFQDFLRMNFSPRPFFKTDLFQHCLPFLEIDLGKSTDTVTLENYSY